MINKYEKLLGLFGKLITEIVNNKELTSESLKELIDQATVDENNLQYYKTFFVEPCICRLSYDGSLSLLDNCPVHGLTLEVSVNNEDNKV